MTDRYQVFHLTGQLDAFSEPVFRKVIGKFVDEGPHHVILDLSAIDFLDSSGLGALVQLAKKCQGYSGTFQVISNARVTQTVKLVRLESFLNLRSSLAEAVEHIPVA
ncbi:STAS domain-containing protein [Anthocerotibacter panamensis]|uniref:STAS domain-containing protein n=1 Tax=Anthocerotibacter panamensis TaxID=2857077 RepID=UPI001C40625D|nr:STAS domain-containing protein [Anthocerotibacter panamensis]